MHIQLTRGKQFEKKLYYHLQKFQIEDKYNCLYYGLSKNKYSYNDEKFNSLNIYRCPKCLKKLNCLNNYTKTNLHCIKNAEKNQYY